MPLLCGRSAGEIGNFLESRSVLDQVFVRIDSRGGHTGEKKFFRSVHRRLQPQSEGTEPLFLLGVDAS